MSPMIFEWYLKNPVPFNYFLKPQYILQRERWSKANILDGLNFYLCINHKIYTAVQQEKEIKVNANMQKS